MLGASWRNAAVKQIAHSSWQEWKEVSGYHRRSLAETLMCRLKILIGPSLRALTIAFQATVVAISAGVIYRLTALAGEKHRSRVIRTHFGQGRNHPAIRKPLIFRALSPGTDFASVPAPINCNIWRVYPKWAHTENYGSR